MGFHVCEYCHNEHSSGDVTLAFANGHSWVMPDMILHYVADHDYLPPDDFIEDILHGQLTGAGCAQSKGTPTPVGYLSGPFRTGANTADMLEQAFFVRLWSLLNKANKSGGRMQTRGSL